MAIDAFALNTTRQHLDRFQARLGGIGKRVIEMLGTILLVILILMLLGAFPAWPHSREWGYGPTGGIGLILVIVLILVLLRHI